MVIRIARKMMSSTGHGRYMKYCDIPDAGTTIQKEAVGLSVLIHP